MSYRFELKSLDALASRLPFGLDDTQEVNSIYLAYRRNRTDGSDFLVDLWTYCYIRRYYLIKFIREEGFRAAELDQIVEKTYKKVEKCISQLEREDRYAQWVSVICKNTYINFVTRRQYVTALDGSTEHECVAPETGVVEDPAALYLTLSRAIERLPVFLRNVVRMRFVEDLSYEEISRLTGKSIPTVRSYVHKACLRFRRDPGMRAYEDWYLR